MTREELEKMFDEKFSVQDKEWWPFGKEEVGPMEIKQFIIDTIIPEVLNSMLINTNGVEGTMGAMMKGFNHQIKQQAKEQFNITL